MSEGAVTVAAFHTDGRKGGQVMSQIRERISYQERWSIDDRVDCGRGRIEGSFPLRRKRSVTSPENLIRRHFDL